MRTKLFKAGIVFAVAAWLVFTLAAQQGEERRRADNAPIELPGGCRVEFKALRSESLGTEQRYSIFFPPSYAQGKSVYPVIYFLHGLNNDHTSWTVDRYGSMQEKFEQMIAKKEVPEFIFVSPEGNNSFYTNYINGGKRYEDYLTQDLIRHMESTYRVRKDAGGRAIAGTSMGGYGALKAAFKHPELYATTVGHSPIVFLGKNPLDVPEQLKSSRMFQYFKGMLGTIYGDPIDQAYWDQNSLLVLAKDTAKLKKLNILFDYGTADRYNQSIRLGEGLKELDKVLTEAGVKHTFHEYPDEPHGWVLVNNHIQESLLFLTQTFNNQ
jgi:enterochelin esterase family protein